MEEEKKNNVISLSAKAEQGSGANIGTNKANPPEIITKIPDINNVKDLPKRNLVEFTTLIQQIIMQQTIPNIMKIDVDAGLSAEDKYKAKIKDLEILVQKLVQIAGVNELLIEIAVNNGFEELLYRSKDWLRKGKKGKFLKDFSRIIIRNTVIDMVNWVMTQLTQKQAELKAQAEAKAEAEAPEPASADAEIPCSACDGNCEACTHKANTQEVKPVKEKPVRKRRPRKEKA